MLSEKIPMRRHSARCSVAVLTMLLLGGGIMVDAASPGADGIQDRQGAAQSTSLDEAERPCQGSCQLIPHRRYNEAIPLAERVLGIREKVLGLHHPDVAASLNNLAELFAARVTSQKRLRIKRATLKSARVTLP